MDARKRRRRRLGPLAFLRTNREASSISRDVKLIKRHQNPLGIFSRVFIYPLIGFGAWRRQLELVVAGVAFEALLWTAVPPVEETFGFVEDAIEKELGWLNAPRGSQKLLSFSLSCSGVCGGTPGVCSPCPRASSSSSTFSCEASPRSPEQTWFAEAPQAAKPWRASQNRNP